MAKKKIGRLRDAEIKKHLWRFAKKEYNEKKPLDVSLLRVNPRVVFKRGGKLPSIVIKNLKKTAYVICLNYGNTMKVYYFNHEGISLGASNVPSSGRIILELLNYTTQILHFPKIQRVNAMDRTTSQFRAFFHRLAHQYSQKFGIKLIPLPAISLKGNIHEKNGIRIGVEQGSDKNILHVDVRYTSPDYAELTLLRELFPILTNTDPERETVQCLSTIWALTTGRTGFENEFFDRMKRTYENLGLTNDVINWIRSTLRENMEEYPNFHMDHFADFFIQAYRMVLDFEPFEKYRINALFLLWIMHNGMFEFREFLQIGNRILRKLWIYYNLLHYLFKNEDFCQVYGIDTEKAQKDESILNLYLFSYVVLDKKSSTTREFFEKIMPDYLEIKHTLIKLDVSNFPAFIPQNLLEETFVKETMFCLFHTKGLIVESIDKMSMASNSEDAIEIRIKNLTPWKLTNARFKADFKPYIRMKLLEIVPTQVSSFTGEITLKLKFKSKETTGRCRLSVKLVFEDPVNPVPGAKKRFKMSYSESIIIKEIDINIQ
uniref:Uncharacterized protein n=1 Tax=Promethearchaeum syntrophicum TaxID=2594042 RepID=A0A5B9DFH3_9ARCH|nr:hypothetical protein [Candidatus Prometheoarchaeum syntrophicum]QEE17771.1 hypothetical protein DSAG12_03609 [Candidatus Prometheoarchaeum syntrophicum]